MSISAKDYCKRQGYQLTAQLASDVPPVWHDPHAISQAILNLFDNAIKFSDSVRQIEVNLRPEPSAVVLEVRDRGTGIPAAEQEKIFEDFYRGSQTASKGGYGIGLYLVRHIMTAHQGTVEV